MRQFDILFALLVLCINSYSQGLTIQENGTGFCSVDGIIDTDVPGYTGDGFANADIAAGTSALWNVDVNEDDTYKIYWRYANGGGSGDLISEVWINEVPVITDFTFVHTGTWTNWIESDTIQVSLESGENRIRLVSVSASGLPNIDFIHFIGDAIQPAYCPPSYAFSLSQNHAEGGSISYQPIQPYYDAGTPITLTAVPAPGYFFHSWSGGTSSTDSVYTFGIDRNADVEALFYPDGTQAEDGVMGYATVQDDKGTPYLMTGGLYGDTVLATSFSTLKSFLEHEDPLVVTVRDHIVATGLITITSDKSLIGISDSAHLEGIRFKINDADNVIIRNLAFSRVVQFDEIEINNAHHIWIDGCEFFTDRDNGPEFYDGLLDIKNASTFITISNTEFHDHYKSILISSGDDSFQDTTVRITFFHNHFHDLESRTPLLRFGKAHILNNYFNKCTSGINSRMGACIRVEENYFYRVSNAVRVDMSDEIGFFQLINNTFDKSSYIPPPECLLEVPYEYESLLIPAAEVPASVSGSDPSVATGDPQLSSDVRVYPNPTSGAFTVECTPDSKLGLYTSDGRLLWLTDCKNGLYRAHLNSYPPGLYVLKAITVNGFAVIKLLKT